MKKVDRFRSVAILGGAGFIGSNLAHHILDTSDAKVHIFDNLSRLGVRYNLGSLQKKAGNSGRLQITIGDVRDSVIVERVLRHATEVYHLAAQVAVTTSVSDPRLDFEVNLQGTFNVLEAARKHGRHPFLFYTSTNKVYGGVAAHRVVKKGTRWEYEQGRGVSEAEPLDLHTPYGCSKGAADQYVHDYACIFGIPTVVFRMSCIAGARQYGNEDQGWVAHFLYSALSNSPVVLYGDGCQVRDVLCIDDLVRAIDAAREHQAVTAGQIYNVGGGAQNTTSLLELIDIIESLTGRRLRRQLAKARPGDQLVYVTDTFKLHRDTGWEPTLTIRETLERIYDFWKRNRDVFAPAIQTERKSAGMLQEVPDAA
jgi:CDP-paratose 2-epimerase